MKSNNYLEPTLHPDDHMMNRKKSQVGWLWKKIQVQGARISCREAYLAYAATTTRSSATQKLDLFPKPSSYKTYNFDCLFCSEGNNVHMRARGELTDRYNASIMDEIKPMAMRKRFRISLRALHKPNIIVFALETMKKMGQEVVPI